MDGRALRASATTLDGHHPRRTARQPFWVDSRRQRGEFQCMHAKWGRLVPTSMHVTSTIIVGRLVGAGTHIPPIHSAHTSLGMGRYGGVFLLQGGEFQRPWKRCSMVPNQRLEVEIAMGHCPVPIYVSSRCFALRYEVPNFLPRWGHLCMAMLTIAVGSYM